MQLSRSRVDNASRSGIQGHGLQCTSGRSLAILKSKGKWALTDRSCVGFGHALPANDPDREPQWGACEEQMPEWSIAAMDHGLARSSWHGHNDGTAEDARGRQLDLSETER